MFFPGLNITCWPIYWLPLIAIHNAMVVYQSLTDDENIHLLKCRLPLAQGLVKRRQFWCSTSCPQLSISWTAANRIYRRTFPQAYSCHRKKGTTSKCVVYTRQGKRRLSVYWCSECEAGLCLGMCFKRYHTNINFFNCDDKPNDLAPHHWTLSGLVHLYPVLGTHLPKTHLNVILSLSHSTKWTYKGFFYC
jgi:hypothetical protein